MLLTINYSGKQLNHSFQIREITVHKLSSLKKMRYCKTMIAKELNKFFKNDVSTLNIAENSFITTSTSDDITDPIDKAIDIYQFYSSILLIQNYLKNHDVFSFKTVEIGDTEKKSTTLILRRQQLMISFLLNF